MVPEGKGEKKTGGGGLKRTCVEERLMVVKARGRTKNADSWVRIWVVCGEMCHIGGVPAGARRCPCFSRQI